MNRNPKAGDVIRIDDKRAEHLVIDSGTQVAQTDAGVGTWPWFTAVPARAADPITGLIDAKKEKKYFTHPVTGEKGVQIVALDQLHLTATAKFSVQKAYKVVKMKDIA